MKIPFPLPETGFSPAVYDAAVVVVDAAERLLSIAPEETSAKLEKPDPNVGHHAIVTKADMGIQGAIISTLKADFPEAHFITEEKAEGFADIILSDQDLQALEDGGGLVFGIDPLDGTSMFQNQLWETAVSIGVMENGAHVGGAISAPYVRGGISVIGERGRGVFINEGGNAYWSRVAVRDRPLKQSVVFIGPDIFFMDQFNRFVNEFSRQVRTTSCMGSCALGLAMVAAGRVDALVQPVQCPWDWFAGYPLVEEVGGRVQFYHYREGAIVALSKPDLPSYSPTGRNTAFIAGAPAVVDWLFQTLQEKYDK